MNLLIAIHIIITACMIAAILLQKGESGGITPSSSNALFTARGSANFLTRITAILASLFIINCIIMTIFASYQSHKQTQVIDQAIKESTKK